MTTTQKTKSYFIGDLIDLVTDLGGTLKNSEKIWKEYINLLRNENVLDERFVLNEESPDVVKLGFQKAANFLEKKLFVSGGGKLHICWHCNKLPDHTSKIVLTEKGTQDINSVIVDKFEASHFFLYLLPEIEDDEMICDVISESAAKITASDSVLLEANNEKITVRDLKTEAVFTIVD